MAVFNLIFPGPDNRNIEVSASSGSFLFVVGANGSGKSTLMHHFSRQYANSIRRLSAHRQVWLQSDTVDLTPAGRQQNETNIQARDTRPESRYRDDQAPVRTQMVMFDILDAENVQNKKIATAFKSNNIEDLERFRGTRSPLDNINHIMAMANIPIEISVGEGGKLLVQRGDYPQYGIDKLSDGERNALLIAANVLTASENTLFLIDEPERHLHRSIVSPLLTTLMALREDCAFVVSTHDMTLPLDQPKASALLMRDYIILPEHWVTDYVENLAVLDEDLARSVLGSRKSLLFVEGSASSLDLQLYQILFPSVTIRAVGSCLDVERNVRGLRASEADHWVSAFGIIDRDNRSDVECSELMSNSIYPLNCYSIESIYYHPEVIQFVANELSTISEFDPIGVVQTVQEVVLSAIEEHKPRMIARIVERQMKDRLSAEAPNWKSVLNGPVTVQVHSSELYQTESQHLEKLVLESDVHGIVARYPIRETPALSNIVKLLGLTSTTQYEGVVRKLASEKLAFREQILKWLAPLPQQFL